jgi:hypothetical protein
MVNSVCLCSYIRNEKDLSSKYYDPEFCRKHSHHEHRTDKPRRLSTHEKDDRDRDSRKHGSTSYQRGIYSHSNTIAGPTLPNRQDLQLQKGIHKTQYH